MMVLASIIQAQTPAYADSLESELLSADSDLAKIDIYLLLSKYYFRVSPNKAFKYGKEALTLSKKINDQVLISRSYASISHSKILGRDKDSVIIYADSAIVIAKNIDNLELQAIALHAKGLTYHLLGKYDESLNNYHEALEINTKLDLKMEALKQLNNIALVRRELKDYDTALEYLQEAEKLAEEVNDLPQKSRVFGNTGYIYLDQKKYDEALPFVQKVFDKNMISNDSLSIAIALNIMAQVKGGLGEYDVAMDNANQALIIAKKIGYSDGLFNAKATKSNLFFKKRAYKNAIEEGLAAFEIADTSLSTRYLDGVLNTLSKSYYAIGDLDNAYTFMVKYNTLRDKIYDKDQQNLSMRLDADYQLKAKETENLNLKREAEVNAELIQNQKYIFWAASFIAFLGIVLSYLLYTSLKFRRNYSKTLEDSIAERTKELEVQNNKLLSSNKELERFAYIASHDLKEPLLNINSFSKLLSKEIENTDNEKLKGYANIINTGSDRMYQLVESILEFSKLADGKVLKFDRVDLNQILEQVRQSLEVKILEENVSLHVKDLPNTYGSASLLSSVFKNLIENAIKFNTSGHPKIEIDYKEENNKYLFSIKDNGIGVKGDFKESIFEMFNRLNIRNEFQGSGMGLSICKKIIELHKGEIWVENNKSEGSTFYFTIPKE
jgi:signal transduction histidine kinase